MMITCSSSIPGKEIKKSFGTVRGNTVRARNIGKDILAAFKNMVGGEIEEYTKLMAESREQAALGANAVIDVDFSTSYIMQNAAEILVFGTAVYVE